MKKTPLYMKSSNNMYLIFIPLHQKINHFEFII